MTLHGVLATKLHTPPPRRSLVPRPRLYARLSNALRDGCPLTLVSAPAGFGKTTLITQWIGENHLPAAWLSLDEDDNDPARFLIGLAAALGTLHAPVGTEAAAWIESPQPPEPRVVVSALINAFSELPDSHVLILDDYHVIGERRVHEAVTLLIEQGLSQLRLLIMTRSDPPLPLARMRARGQLAEIRAADLRFTPTEAGAFLTRVMQLPLSDTAVGALERRTEGWIAGLQLAALSMQGRGDLEGFAASFSGSHYFIIDYLTEEVLNRQPSPVRAFLLQTSILDRLCGPLCDAVMDEMDERRTTNDEGQESVVVGRLPGPFALEELERANLFVIPLDDERRWYRYHPLFADLLRSRLERECRALVPELHRRASRWLAQAGDTEEAMKHALAAPDLDLAARLAELCLQPLLRTSRIATCLQWIGQLPESLLTSRAYLCVGCGWTYSISGQPALAERYVQAGEVALGHFEPLFSPSEQRWITAEEVGGQLTAIRAYCARQREDFPAAIALTEQALQQLPPALDAIRSLVALNLALLYMETGQLDQCQQACLQALATAQRPPANFYVSVTALSMLGASALYQGQLSAAADYCRRAIELGTMQSGQALPVQAVGYAHGWLVAVHYQRNEMAEAEQHLEIACELIQLIGPQESIVYSHLYRARLAMQSRLFQPAQASLQHAEALMQLQTVGGNIRLEWVVDRANLHLLQGEAAAACDWLEGQGVREADLAEPAVADPHRPALHLRLPAYVLLARALLALEQVDRAALLLERVRRIAEDSHYTEVWLETLAFQAVVADCRGDRALSLRHLKLALTGAAAEGWKRPILNAGEPLVPLLRQAVGDGIQVPFALSLLEDLAGLAGSHEKPRSEAESRAARLVEPLTERELEVLRLIADGLSNLEIATRLVITVGTVKAHTSNLYGKLDVNTRTRAIARGRALGLL